MEPVLTAGLPGQGSMELKLQDVGQKVASIGHIGRHVVLGARIEIAFRRGPREARCPDTCSLSSHQAWL